MTVDIRIHGVGDYELLADVTFESEFFITTVYAGLRFNGANIPKILHEEIGCPTDFILESVLHDPLYGAKLIPRKACDQIFYEAAIAQGVDPIKAEVMRLGLELGGEEAYNSDYEKRFYYREFIKVVPKT